MSTLAQRTTFQGGGDVPPPPSQRRRASPMMPVLKKRSIWTNDGHEPARAAPAPPAPAAAPSQRMRVSIDALKAKRRRVPKAVQYTFTALFSRVVSEKRREQSAKRYKHAVPMPKWRYYLPGARKSSATATGDKRLHDLRAALSRLDGLGYRRSMHQVAFHEAFIGACIAQIYGDDLYRNIVRIMDENGFDELSTEISVICPRRWGKTTAVSLFVAALLYTQPAVDVAIYSVSRRASNSLLRKIFLILRKLWGDDLSSVVAFNQEELRVRTINGGESVVWSYPSNVNAARQRLDSEWARTCFADPEDYDRLTAEWNQEVLEANAGEHRTTTCMCLPWDSIARQQ